MEMKLPLVLATVQRRTLAKESDGESQIEGGEGMAFPLLIEGWDRLGNEASFGPCDGSMQDFSERKRWQKSDRRGGSDGYASVQRRVGSTWK